MGYYKSHGWKYTSINEKKERNYYKVDDYLSSHQYYCGWGMERVVE